MNKIQIRTIQPEDISKIVDIEMRVDLRHADPEDVIRRKAELFPDWFFVAQKGNEIAGYAEACQLDASRFQTYEDEKRLVEMLHNPENQSSYLIFLMVDAPFKNNGIASKLINHFIDESVRRNLKKSQLVAVRDCHTGNEMVPFYQRFGFEPVTYLPNFYQECPGTLMEKVLN